ncbi:ABC transporter permease [Dethiobacter alkaliphilus]|uniref:ABC transporter permease n=1 Tax=Dethiobacter alkaliphilus TaxID=427926 RepID=UPI002227FD05|nr:ABC transporter permease [Dethiobacter alkaliphilus]MCW3490645.1 ABC transporter permease [Dethiobacter alkaliphilus]
MNGTLFKATLKANWVIALIIFLVMLMYLSVIISMFDPESMEGLIAMMETMPRELISAMGMDDLSTELTAFLGSYYYGFIAIMFPMIYCIIVGNRLVARHVDSGSMAYLLSTPHTRATIISTQALYFLISITVLMALVTLLGLAFAQALFPGELNVSGFLQINLNTLLTTYAVSGICFFFSCLFDDTKYSLAFGAGVPIAFFVLNMLANVSEQYAWIGNFSLYTLLDPGRILSGDTFMVMAAAILIAVSLATYIGGITIFNRRSLPL